MISRKIGEVVKWSNFNKVKPFNFTFWKFLEHSVAPSYVSFSVDVMILVIDSTENKTKFWGFLAFGMVLMKTWQFLVMTSLLTMLYQGSQNTFESKRVWLFWLVQTIGYFDAVAARALWIKGWRGAQTPKNANFWVLLHFYVTIFEI